MLSKSFFYNLQFKYVLVSFGEISSTPMKKIYENISDKIQFDYLYATQSEILRESKQYWDCKEGGGGRCFQNGKFELLALTETKLKDKEVSGFEVNVIVGVQEMERVIRD